LRQWLCSPCDSNQNGQFSWSVIYSVKHIVFEKHCRYLSFFFLVFHAVLKFSYELLSVGNSVCMQNTNTPTFAFLFYVCKLRLQLKTSKTTVNKFCYKWGCFCLPFVCQILIFNVNAYYTITCDVAWHFYRLLHACTQTSNEQVYLTKP